MSEQWRQLWRGKWRRDPGNDGALYGDEGYDQIAAFIQESGRLLETESVLDIGCGTGRVLSRLQASRRVGLDIYDPRSFPASCEFFKGVAGDLSFDDDEFDFVYCHGMLQFLDDDELRAALDEIDRVGRRSILLDIPDRNMADDLHAERHRIRPSLPHHHTHCRETFEGRGYRIEAVELPLTIGWQFKFNAFGKGCGQCSSSD